jgi:hypothetical protein
MMERLSLFLNKRHKMNISHHLRLFSILLIMISLTNISCGQDQMQTSVSKQINGEQRRGITEGVIGQVKARDGEAVVGAMIMPTPLSTVAPPVPEIAIITDKDGRYEWPLPPGPYQITVLIDGFRKQAKKVEIMPSQVSTLDFTLD